MQPGASGPPITVQSVIESPMTTTRAGIGVQRSSGPPPPPSGVPPPPPPSDVPPPPLASGVPPPLASVPGSTNGSSSLEQAAPTAVAATTEHTSRNRDMVTLLGQRNGSRRSEADARRHVDDVEGSAGHAVEEAGRRLVQHGAVGAGHAVGSRLDVPL